MKRSQWLVLFMLMLSIASIAAVCRSAVSQIQAQDARVVKDVNFRILNFEDDYVHGRTLTPDVLVQLGRTPRFLDEVIYLRNDFNDFHEADMKARPRFRPQ